MREASPAQAFMEASVRTYTTGAGLTCRFRRLHIADVADIPDAWPMFHLGLYHAIKGGARGHLSEEQATAFVEKFEKQYKALAGSDRNIGVVICRAVLEPAIYDPETTKDPPEDAIPLWALGDVVDRDTLFQEIMAHASGLSPTEQEAEAKRLGEFREGAETDDPATPGHVEANGAAGESDPGDREPVGSDGVGSGAGAHRGDGDDARPEEADAAAGR